MSVAMNSVMSAGCSARAARVSAPKRTCASLAPSTSYLALPARAKVVSRRGAVAAKCSIADEFPKFAEKKEVKMAGSAAAFASAALAAQALGVDPAHAADLVAEAASEPFPYFEVYGTYVLVGGFWFVVGPTMVYAYLRERWFNRSKYETVFQFFLVFFFFPGMLLMSPFLNLRPDPTADKPRIW